MLNVNKEKYYNQVNSLNVTSLGLNMNDFDFLFNVATGKMEGVTTENVNPVVDRVIRSIFSLNYAFTEPVLPLKFLDTELGRVILKVRFGLSTGVYLIPDLVKLTGYSVQYISQEAKRGNIVGEQRGKIWLFTAENVETYMVKKGFLKSKSFYPVQDEFIYTPDDREVEYKTEKKCFYNIHNEE